MIEIDEPPDIAACATCGGLVWLWSPRREAWVCFVLQPQRDLLRVHACRHAQDFATWKDTTHGVPPPAEYVEAKRALTTPQDRIEEE